MSTCPSCGGVINRDCYNPIECAQISSSQDQHEMLMLNAKVDMLIKSLKGNGIKIPNLNPPQPESTQTNFDDDLPF